VADDRGRIEEQIAYYRARAAEYDTTSMPDGDPFATHAEAIRAALAASVQGGRVLEIAAGTGQWTGLLAERANELVVTDASPEMLELNRSKVGERANVRYEVIDAFAMPASHAFDTVFFGFFLSHVPPGRFEAFWAVLDGLLAPGGRVLFADEAAPGISDEEWIDRAAGLVHRRLRNGSRFRAVKVLWEPADLERRLSDLGWGASVHAAGPFYWGIATP
jgi:demethylmenaquinone methyltransferase/2-methoxy-6-polyprenyl-1,4-benzoquinol methylase